MNLGRSLDPASQINDCAHATKNSHTAIKALMLTQPACRTPTRASATLFCALKVETHCFPGSATNETQEYRLAKHAPQSSRESSNYADLACQTTVRCCNAIGQAPACCSINQGTGRCGRILRCAAQGRMALVTIPWGARQTGGGQCRLCR